jgi:AcrR family transcriptional regulator
MEDVAVQAGVGKATVYRRWRSKGDLVVAAMGDILLAEVPDADTGSIEGDLRSLIQDTVRFAASSQGARFLRMCLSESLRDERVAALYRKATEQRVQRLQLAVTRAVDRGEVRADTQAEHISSWVGGLVAHRLIADLPMPSRDEVEAMLRFTLRGIAADPGAV